MLDRSAQLATRYVRTHEAARMLGISPRTLEKYRCHGSGPTFRKLGGRVVYAVDDLEAWADKAAYDQQAADLASRFEANFHQFDAPEAVRAAGPRADAARP